MGADTPSPRYVDSRIVGDATVSAINEGSGPYRPELADADGREVGTETAGEDGVPIGFHVLHIRTPAGSLLVDAGFDDPESTWGTAFAQQWSGLQRTPGLLSALRDLGQSVDSIRCIALTHAHFDHVAGLTVERDGKLVPRFPRAQVYLGRGDWESPQEEDEQAPEIHQRLAVIEAAGLLRLVDERQELLPGIEMIVTGGESPGHAVIRLRSGNETFYALGDLFHFDFEVSHEEWMAPWVDRGRMLASRQQILEQAAESGAMAVFTHHPFPPWGRLRRVGSGHVWETC